MSAVITEPIVEILEHIASGKGETSFHIVKEHKSILTPYVLWSNEVHSHARDALLAFHINEAPAHLLERVIHLLGQFPQLVSLRLNSTALKATHFLQMKEFLCKSGSALTIRRVEFRDNSLQSGDTEAFAELLKIFKNIQRLTIAANTITEQTAPTMRSALCDLVAQGELQHLVFDRNKLSDESVATIFSSMSASPCPFRLLDFGYNNLTSKSLSTIGGLLVVSAECNTIILEGNHIGAGKREPLRKFMSVIGPSRVTMINLAKNGIMDNEFHQILHGMKHISRPIELNVSDNAIGSGIEALGQALGRSSCPLSRINLRGNSIPDTALAFFAGRLRECKAPIRSINLSKNNVTTATGSLLLQACALNPHQGGIQINLDDNEECESLTREVRSLEDKLKGVPYASHPLVTVTVLGKEEEDMQFCRKQLNKFNTYRAPSNATLPLVQLPPVLEKSVKEYYYSFHYHNRRNFLHYGRLMTQCFRMMYLIVEDIDHPDMITRLRSWVPLIEATSAYRVSLTFALIIRDPKMKPDDISAKEAQVHELITELQFIHKYIEITDVPMFIKSKANGNEHRNCIRILQSTAKRLVDSNPVYLPRRVIEKLVPVVKYPLTMAKSELTKQIETMLQVTTAEAVRVVQKMDTTGAVYLLSRDRVYLEPQRFILDSIQLLKTLSMQRKEERSNDLILCTKEIFSEADIPAGINFADFVKQFSEFLVRQRVWFPLGRSETPAEECEDASKSLGVCRYFFPALVSVSLFQDKGRRYRLGGDFDLESGCFLGRRLVFSASQPLAPSVWYSIQARLYQLVAMPQSDEKPAWECYMARECIRFTHHSGAGFRLYFQLRHSHPLVFRMLEVHACSPNVAGTSAILNCVLSEIYLILYQNDVDDSYLLNTRIMLPLDVFKWSPTTVNKDIHTYTLSSLLSAERKSKTLHDTNVHRLIPDVLVMDPAASKVKPQWNERMLMINISVCDILGHLRVVPQDHLVVFLLRKDGQSFEAEKEYVPGSSFLVYSYLFPDGENIDEYVLIVASPECPVLVGGTPLFLGEISEDEKERWKPLLADWESHWKPAQQDTEQFKFSDPSPFLELRKQQLKSYIQAPRVVTPSLTHQSSISSRRNSYEPRKDNYTELEYLQICVDAVELSNFAYVEDPCASVARHQVQRAVNNYEFRYNPNFKQRIQIFLFSPTVDLWLMSGRTCFFTFERGEELYICIRGTKTSADILADLKYSLTPYDSTRKDTLFRTTKNKIRGNKAAGAKVEMIHNGFSRYAEKIIQNFEEAYSELLNTDKFEQRTLIICGHSLGGGIAQVLARKFLEKHWQGRIICATFGSPLIGNTLFCQWPRWRNSPNLSIFNFANQKDPVPNMLVRSWSLFTHLRVAPTLDFGYTGHHLYVFSENTSTLEIVEHAQVIEFLTSQVAWNPRDLYRYLVTHGSCFYLANVKKLLADYLDPTKENKFILPTPDPL